MSLVQTLVKPMVSAIAIAIIRARSALFSPLSYFTAGEQGVWYDPSDLSTLFQDAAGTTPVTAAGQPVGLMLDKSGNGNHASQHTASKRPVLSSRVNLVTQSESLASGDWVKVGTTPTQVSGAVWKLVPTVTNTEHSVSHNLAPVTGLQCWTAECKADGLTKISLREGLTSGAYVTVDLLTATMITVGNAPDSYQITQLADGWVRISLAKAPAGAFGRKFNFVPNTYTTGDPNNIFFAGDGVSGVLVRYPQCNYGSTAQPYQWITTGTEYDTVGFPWYLKFDGVDDFMSTAAIDFSGTYKVSAWTGALSSVGAGSRTVVDNRLNTSTNSNRITIQVPQTTKNVFFGCGGTGWANNTVAGVTQGVVHLITAQGDILAPLNSISIDGGTPVEAAGGQGVATGGYGGNPLYIGAAAGGSTAIFNGNIYSIVIAGALYDADTVAKMNAWTAKKTGVTI